MRLRRVLDVRRDASGERRLPGWFPVWAETLLFASLILSLFTVPLFVVAGAGYLAVRRAIAGFGTALAGAVAADSAAAARLAATPAPPPIAGTEAQAAELGPAVVALCEAGDADGAARLLDHRSLSRGLVPPEAWPDPKGSPGGATAEPKTPMPPGTLTLMFVGGGELQRLWDGARPPHGTVRADGATAIDGLPAAVLVVTATTPPAEGPAEWTVLLIPSPDGKIGAVYFADAGEYLADRLRRTVSGVGPPPLLDPSRYEPAPAAGSR